MSERRVKTLAERVRWQLVWLGSGLFLASLSLIFLFSWNTVNFTADSMMLLEAQSLIKLSTDHPGIVLPNDRALSATREWQTIPDSVRQHFNQDEMSVNEVAEALLTLSDGTKEYLYLLHYVDESRGELYLSSRHGEDDIDSMLTRFIVLAFQQAIWITLLIFVALFFMVRWLIRSTTEPLSMLSQWAGELNEKPDRAMQVSFPIEELNQLAGQLRAGVEEIEAVSRREQQFLKHTSHELRTPLATLQASLDTLQLTAGDEVQNTVSRAMRAGDNMNRLSSSLLWLARESEQLPESRDIMLDEFCSEAIAEHRYLLRNCPVEVLMQAPHQSIKIEADLLAIVLANLVRNAYQHSSDGEIQFTASVDGLRISNPVVELDKDDRSENRSLEPSFGLGLELVKRICRKLGWSFQFNQQHGVTTVDVRWSVDTE